MPAARRFRAPAGNGEVLAAPDFAAVPGLVAENRRRLDRDDVTVGGLTLREFRRQAREEVIELASGAASARRGVGDHSDLTVRRSPDAPLLVAGHQPELSHPGVWVKHFALNGLARRLGGTPLNLVVDNDTLKNPSLRFPVFADRDPESVHLASVRYDTIDGETYEDRSVFDPDLFRTFAARAAPLWRNWGYEPALPAAWEYVTRFDDFRPKIGELFAAVRRRFEHGWGCHNLELPVSGLAKTEAFARFARHLLADLPRFRAVYNAAIRDYRAANGIRSANHPAPELAEGEAPFWVRTTLARRERATAASDVRTLRPRALTLTLFARVCLGDFFIHGIGGGKYDEVTDAIIRGYFGIDPPAYQVLSATLHLPLPGFPATTDDVRCGERLVRELTWMPERHLSVEDAADPRVSRLIAEKATYAAAEPPYREHAARRQRFHDFRRVTEALRPLVAGQLRDAEAALARARVEAHANAVLRRRDYSWVLYPEDVLRPFLTRFLNDG